jgi:DNA-binding CsgD family transcriptional regulator/tetratricopeptide (TPR) repeat protein
LSGDHAAAVTSLRELADRSGAVDGGGVRRRLALQYELLGHWSPALAAREAAADAFARAGLPGEAAVERLAIAAHLRSAASFRAALDALDSAEESAAAAGRAELVCRIGGLRGNVLARAGRPQEGVPTVRAALEAALAHGFVAAAAEIYQRLADSLEHAGDYRGAGRAYDSAYEFCQAHGQDASGQLCRACATVVLFHCGRWDRAVALCGAVLADPAATAHARAVASGIGGLVHAMRGQAGAARAALLDSRATAGRIDLLAMKVLSTWGIALLDEADGRPARAAESYRHVVAYCRDTQERHYCVPVLQFAVARFADDGAVSDVGAATAVLADAVATTGQPEARAAFAYALGESALAAGEAGQALPHLRRAVDLLDGLALPVVDALVRHRTGIALAAGGAAVPEATALLRDAYRTARRLRARLLVSRIGVDLDRLGATPSPTATVLTAREAQVLRLVGDGLTSREIGQRLYLSVRTVEMHVRNGVAKLGCRTRAEAVRRLTVDDPR